MNGAIRFGLSVILVRNQRPFNTFLFYLGHCTCLFYLGQRTISHGGVCNDVYEDAPDDLKLTCCWPVWGGRSACHPTIPLYRYTFTYLNWGILNISRAFFNIWSCIKIFPFKNEIYNGRWSEKNVQYFILKDIPTGLTSVPIVQVIFRSSLAVWLKQFTTFPV